MGSISRHAWLARLGYERLLACSIESKVAKIERAAEVCDSSSYYSSFTIDFGVIVHRNDFHTQASHSKDELKASGPLKHVSIDSNKVRMNLSTRVSLITLSIKL